MHCELDESCDMFDLLEEEDMKEMYTIEEYNKKVEEHNNSVAQLNHTNIADEPW